MTRNECAKVLAKIQLVDNRQVDELTLSEWFDVLEPVDFGDAVEAVRIHRRTSLDYIQPAHVVQLAKRVKRDRESAAWSQLSIAERTRLAEDIERRRLVAQGVLES